MSRANSQSQANAGRVAAEEFQGNDRFVIERRLGSGSFGVVYLAFDRARNSQVALKTLRKTLWRENSQALYRFKQEFRALTDVSHPNLITLYELFSDGEQWFFTMELIEGVNFLAAVRDDYQVADSESLAYLSTLQVPGFTALAGGSNGGSDRSESDQAITVNQPRPTAAVNFTLLREILKQLAAGLSALHQAGKLHRDIKPTNVMVTPAGRVVILDFGLVMELVGQLSDEEQDLVGTPTHMSPEQATGVAITAASDWYSVGVMLYQALTGQLPFDGTMLEILMKKQSQSAPTPSSLIADLPEDLNKLCRDLLRRDPLRRPIGSEVLRRLAGLPSDQLSVGAPRPLSLTGRAEQLAALTAGYQQSRAGQASILLLHGSSGMGKSSLIRHFLDELGQRETDLVVLSGRCYEREAVPFKAIDSLIDALSKYLRSIDADTVDGLMPADIQALARLFPVLRQVDAVIHADRRVLELTDSHELRRRAFAALRELLVRLAQARPLILLIDDLQWGDLDSAALLGELLCLPDPPVLLLIASYRDEEIATSPFLKAFLPLLKNVETGVSAREVVVGELNESEATALALRLLGGYGDAAFEQAELIASESGGNPFFIDELVRYAQLTADTGEWPVVRQNNQTITLARVIQFRIDRLGAEARQLMEIVAVAGQPIALAVARQAAQLPNAEPAILSILRAGNLLRTRSLHDRIVLEPYHDRIRETVVAQLPDNISRSHHLNLAETYEASQSADAETVANHFREAGQPSKAAHYAVLAADQAAQALAFDRAAQLYRLALELREKIDQIDQSELSVNRLQIKLGDALANGGRGAEAAQAYLSAAPAAEMIEAIELYRRAAEQLLICGHIDEGVAALERVLKMVNLKLPKTPRRALLSLLLGRFWCKLRGLGFRERADKDIPTIELLRVDICWSGALGLSLVDTIRGADFQTRHLLLALRAGELKRVARALAAEAGYLAAAGGRNNPLSEQYLNDSMTLAEQLNDPNAIALTTITSGVAAFCYGRFQTAYELVSSAAEILRDCCTGVVWERNTANYYILRSLYYLGEWREICEQLPALLQEAQARGDLYVETNLRTRMFYLSQLVADDPERAQREVYEAIGRWSHQGFHQQHFYYLFAQIQIELYLGDSPAAWQRINDTWPALKRSLLMRAQIVAVEAQQLRARCALARVHDLAGQTSAASERDNLLRTAERDAEGLWREQVGWAQAFSQLIRASIAAARGQRASAIEQLAAAEQTFIANHMSLYQAVAERRRGQLMNSDEGTQLIAKADQWMRGQAIKNPARMADMLAPGIW